MDFGTQQIVEDGRNEAFEACRDELLSRLKLFVPTKVAWKATYIESLDEVFVIEVERIPGGIRAHCVNSDGTHFDVNEADLSFV